MIRTLQISLIGLLCAFLALSTGCKREKPEENVLSAPVEADSVETQALTVMLPLGKPVYDPAESFTVEDIPDSIRAIIEGCSLPSWAPVGITDLRYVRVLHYDILGQQCQGELVCNKAIAQDLVEIFRELYDARYPIERITLVDNYDGDDEASMSANNTSCLNCRAITAGTVLSRHAWGMAIDINPLYNPYYRSRNGEAAKVAPEISGRYIDRNLDHPYMIKHGDACHRAFISRGFSWGGTWRSAKDYQHFEKR